MLRRIAVAGQVVGIVAAMIGVYLLAGLAWCLVVSGALVLVVGTAAEAILGRPVAPSDRRDGPNLRRVA